MLHVNTLHVFIKYYPVAADVVSLSSRKLSNLWEILNSHNPTMLQLDIICTQSYYAT